ncbi:glycosyltransferase family 4 protein [Lactobacillus acetotolerans]|jgi:1,2-diacylglycerol 3-alpha-glucosyltransferase|uniref:Glycosyltransferase n=1 Tax=Lactobacillus acetotolerans TaxID=1600 RepID=A0A0D6A2H9_9LACO|nr:glycosyltransferase family 4 protein [Lactobacillus acetotolerans]KRN38429.1 group 1 glycosyl transferase [Lactobacillus acetotolerans DSM 20749 = JCM 3825]QFG50965.1 glycosyltransferase family 4 protein [Lactobacillus acetotolerans]QGV04927.1 glycosyltransferase [Lactobacillus acetotolerans]BAQ56879.1 glycosyltransferase [Lactobacillus acetotolerans]GGV17248.1 glycosyl transferase [Lactobacillus acetotolerans DSM 20749 = JCM 3825]
MNIGLFTDTYFPQISGVATSIKTLKNALEKQGHNVFIFTTTDPHIKKGTVEPNVFRFSSIPFISFTDRRIAFRGFFEAAKVAKEVKLDIVHTQTEFALGMMGKYVAHRLKIPAIHTYHTMYEDYLHYVLNGHLLRPYHVKQFTKGYLKNMNGVIAPSERVEALLKRYGVKIPIRIIPTGVDIESMNEDVPHDVRKDLHIDKDAPVLLTLSRVASEKKINHILNVMPDIVEQFPNVRLVIAGDGPDVDVLKDQIERLTLENYVIFTGNIPHEDVGNYYRMADLFVSASDTETQGLTYIEALAAGTRCVVYDTDYTEHVFDDDSLGRVFTTQSEMLKDILIYLKQGRSKIPQDKLDAKLAQISSKHFGDQVYNFYQDVIKKYQEDHKEDLND